MTVTRWRAVALSFIGLLTAGCGVSVVDLRDKMTQLSQEQVADQVGARSESIHVASEDSVRGDALSALLNLGYQRSAAEKAIDAALGEGGDITVESILRRGLKKLARV